MLLRCRRRVTNSRRTIESGVEGIGDSWSTLAQKDTMKVFWMVLMKCSVNVFMNLKDRERTLHFLGSNSERKLHVRSTLSQRGATRRLKRLEDQVVSRPCCSWAAASNQAWCGMFLHRISKFRRRRSSIASRMHNWLSSLLLRKQLQRRGKERGRGDGILILPACTILQRQERKREVRMATIEAGQCRRRRARLHLWSHLLRKV